MEQKLSKEKISKIEQIIFKDYQGFTKEEQEEIRTLGKDISFVELYEYLVELEENDELDQELAEKIVNEEFFHSLVSVLYSSKEITENLKKYNFASDLPIILEVKKRLGIEEEYTIPYVELLENAIETDNYYELDKIYKFSYQHIDIETKIEVIKYYLRKKDRIYITEDNIDNFIDIIKVTKELDVDNAIFFKKIIEHETSLAEFCLRVDDELIDDLEKNMDEKNKVVLDHILFLRDSKEITQEQLNGILESLDGYVLKRAVASYAVKKGFVPKVKDYEKRLYGTDDSIAILSNKNLIYYLLSKDGYNWIHLEEKVEKTLDSELKKQVHKFLKKYQISSIFGTTDNVLFELEDIFKEENLQKYFDENGCKKEFLFEVIEKFNNIEKRYYNKTFIYFCFNECKDKLTEEELKYYDYIITTLKYCEDSYNSSIIYDALNKIANNKEEFYKIIKDEEKILQIIKESNKDLGVIFGLLKVNGISQRVKDELFNEREKASLNIIEEIINKNQKWEEEIKIICSIYNNKEYLDEKGQITGEFFKGLIKSKCVESLLVLDDKYITPSQKKFISIVAPIIKQNDDIQKQNQIEFICNTFFEKELIEKYIVDNKATKALIDKFFEEGCLSCISSVEEYEHYLTDKQKIILNVYKDIQDIDLKGVYEDFISGSIEAIYSGTIQEEVITTIPDLLKKIRLSNSSEISGRYINIATMILQNTSQNKEDPIEQFTKIEKIFLTRNLSHMDKIFNSFKLLYPHEKLIQTILDKKDSISPILLSYASPEDTILGREAEKIYGDKTYAVEMLMYADLLKTTIASNDKTFIEYIENIEKGNLIFSELIEGKKDIYNLSSDDKYILNTYIYHLESLYNKQNPTNQISLSENLEENLYVLINIYKEIDISKIPDQIIRNNYYAYIQVETLQELKDMMNRYRKEATENGKNNSKIPLVLEKGDLIKGIGGISYLDTIIQHGSVSKEFLGGNVNSDLTPFDTDLSIVVEPKEDNKESLSRLEANSYGPIYFVIKNAVNKYNCTRGNGVKEFQLVEDSSILGDYEIFKTLGLTHYGIRTGFATSQINYICCDNKELVDKIGLILAKNGFYFPVVDIQGELLFTPENYENLRKKMNGLSYYGINNYEFADNLSNEYTLELVDAISDNIEQTALLRSKLEEKLRVGFNSSGLQMKTIIDGDLQSGSVELIDTGSTGRGTNQIGDGDFDYLVRIDRSESYDRKAIIANNVCEGLGIDKKSGDLRKAKVNIDGKEVEVDISYALKSDKITYTTDMCLSDRLETIKKQDPDKYLLVLSNIVLAKTLLKKGECYKPHHAGENPQGGLGGVGTENWILQNGGSLEEAAEEFLIASGVMKVIEIDGKKEIVIDETSRKAYDDFKISYSVWDFGQNQLSEEKSRAFPHDNFVWNNMNSTGYVKMVKTMQTYILELHPEIKFIPSESKENLNTVDTVRSFLNGLKSSNTYQEDSNTDKLGK